MSFEMAEAATEVEIVKEPCDVCGEMAEVEQVATMFFAKDGECWESYHENYYLVCDTCKVLIGDEWNPQIVEVFRRELGRSLDLEG